MLKSKIVLKIKGKNINRFIKKIINKNIELLKINYINKKEVEIIIYKKDYEKLLKYKSIYEITEIDSYGLIKIEEIVKLNKYLIIFLILGIILLKILSNVVFKIEIMHNSKNIRNIVKEELDKYGIKKYSFKKNYKELEKIKVKILNDYPNDIEWIEIEENGTKYIVKIEQRKTNIRKMQTKERDIIAKKDAVIKKIINEKGETVLLENEYVKKGSVIISGTIHLNEESKGYVRAQGKVYGEVWYIVKTKYPFAYYEEKETNDKKNVFALKILNKTFEFTLNKYKTKKINEKTIYKSNILPINFVKQKQTKTKIINQIITFDEALIKAKQYAYLNMKTKLDEKEYIIKTKHLKSSIKNSTIELETFFSVYEDITGYKKIEKK